VPRSSPSSSSSRKRPRTSGTCARCSTRPTTRPAC
jgi:hypothetical protein